MEVGGGGQEDVMFTSKRYNRNFEETNSFCQLGWTIEIRYSNFQQKKGAFFV